MVDNLAATDFMSVLVIFIIVVSVSGITAYTLIDFSDQCPPIRRAVEINPEQETRVVHSGNVDYFIEERSYINNTESKNVKLDILVRGSPSFNPGLLHTFNNQIKNNDDLEHIKVVDIEKNKVIGILDNLNDSTIIDINNVKNSF